MNFNPLFLLLAGFCFIFALRGFSSAQTARRGNLWGMGGMLLALIVTLGMTGGYRLAGVLTALALGGAIGSAIAFRLPMAALPQLVAAFHSLVGLAATLIAIVMYAVPGAFKIGMPGTHLGRSVLLEIGLGAIIGAITFTGSLVAFAKLQGILKGTRGVLRLQPFLNALTGLLILGALAGFIVLSDPLVLLILIALAFYLGAGLILPIGGADMPVVVSLLNSYSGWTAAATGFTMNSAVLIITGALVGSSGAILSSVMCKNMNRSLFSVLFGRRSPPQKGKEGGGKADTSSIKVGNAEEAAAILRHASSVIIVPGYGMAVAQAQRALQEMAALLIQDGIRVRYAIHPVAGRMPGHMNVLLAEANVSYDDVFELDDINADFACTDVAFVIGANDVTNPAAHNDAASPLYGMPILNVEDAGTVLFVKRSLGAGYAGVDNELFYNPKTMMILGDARKVCEGIVQTLK